MAATSLKLRICPALRLRKTVGHKLQGICLAGNLRIPGRPLIIGRRCSHALSECAGKGCRTLKAHNQAGFQNGTPGSEQRFCLFQSYGKKIIFWRFSVQSFKET